MDDLKAKGTRALMWDYLGKMSTQGMNFIVSIFLARLLEPSDFGLVAMVMVIIGIAGIFTDVGLGSALIQRRRVLSIHYSSVFYFNIFVGLLLTLITYISASWIAEFYNNELLVPLAQVMALLFIVNAFSSVQRIQLRKELNYVLLTKLGLASSLASGVVGVSLAFLGAGVWSLVAQTFTLGVIYNILIWTAGKWSPSLTFSWKALTQLWGFGFRMFLVGLLDAIYTRMDYMIIGKLFLPATLGLFQRAKSLNMMAIQYASGSLMSVLFPVLSKVKNDLPRFQNIIIKGLGIICFVVFLIFGGLYLVADELIVFLFSEKWLPSAEYFKLLALSGFAYPINALLVTVLSSRGNSKAFLRIAIYKKSIGFTNLGVGFMYGIEGYLYGLVIVAVINTSITIFAASREASILKIDLYKPIIIQAIIAGITLLATLYITRFFLVSGMGILLFKVTFFPLSYIAISWVLKASSYIYFLEQFLPAMKHMGKKLGITWRL